jgi:predicted dehydrogenase
MEKVRFGIVGTNFISDWVVAGGREDPRFQAVAVCSRSVETGRKFAVKHAIPHVFTSLEEMVGGSLIDAVYVASPNVCHASQSILAMQHGKHVLCEKPLAASAKEAKEMIQASVDQHVTLMEAMKPTLTPAFRVVSDALTEIGTIRQYFACFCQYSSRYDVFKAGTVLNAFDPNLGGGALMDIGVYTIYPMVALFGRPLNVQATVTKLSNGIDGHGCVHFSYPNGLIANVIYGKISDSKLPTEIQGENGRITIDRINAISHATLTLRTGVEHNLLIHSDYGKYNEYFYEIEEFINLIQMKQIESKVNSHENSLVTLEIADEIKKQCL